MNIIDFGNFPSPVKVQEVVIVRSAEEHARLLAASIKKVLKVEINPLEVHLLLRLCAQQMNWKINDRHQNFKSFDYFKVQPNLVGYLLKELRIFGGNEMNKVIASLPSVESYIKQLLQQQFAVRTVDDFAVLKFLEDKKATKPQLLTQDLISSTILEMKMRLGVKMG